MRKMNMAPNLNNIQNKIRYSIEILSYLASEDCTDVAADYQEEIETAVYALIKQRAMKPYKKHATQIYCPVCNKRLRSGNGSSSFVRDYWCNHCGQAIDWEEVNE